MDNKISVIIATYNMSHLIEDTINSIMAQEYKNKEIIIYDDLSTDGTQQKMMVAQALFPEIKYIRGTVNKGVGGAFNEAIKHSTGDYVVLMCADDLFLNSKVLSDIAMIFNECPTIGHVSRWYNQFIDGHIGAVRAWRTYNPLIQANNPSGLAFRKTALSGCECSNRMFVETTQLVKQVLDKGWHYHIIKYDTIGARVHKSTSTQKGYWLKRRVSSPITDWVSLGCKEMLKDYCSFIQIKNSFTTKALLEEIWCFIKLRPINLAYPAFWMFSLISLLTPRFILRHLPAFYRHRIGRFLTREAKR